MQTRECPVYVGFSPEELIASTIAEDSIRRLAKFPVGQSLAIRRLSRQTLGDTYHRTTIVKGAYRRWDVLSQAPMSTDHAIARFFIPWLCNYQGFAVFVDGDILCFDNIWALFMLAESKPEKAVWCVQHSPLLKGGAKKGDEVQSPYARKNWSSVMVFNCGHPANQALTPEYLNTLPGRDLHRFCWLRDEDLGALSARWNVLVNLSPDVNDPAIVHFTEGVPMIEGHEADPYAEEWWDAAALAGFKLGVRVAAVD